MPQNEDILDFATGYKEFRIIKRAHNLCYVHPAQAGIRSDLPLITSTGRVYSFLLTEISNEPSAEPDLKLSVEPKDKSSIGGVTTLQGYVRTSEAEAYKKELQALHAQRTGRFMPPRVAEQVNKYKTDYQKKLLFDYELDKKAPRELFLVSMIYYDDAFTYIMCAAPEKPALYEIKDGKPNLCPSSSTTLSSGISSKNFGSGPSSARRRRSSSSAISASTVLFGAAVLIGP